MRRWSPRIGMMVTVLVSVGCSGVSSPDSADARVTGPTAVTGPTTLAADTSVPASGTACDWVTDATVTAALGGPATVVAPLRSDDDHWSCTWRNQTAELSLGFVHFHCCGRSVEAELIRIGGEGGGNLVTVADVRGAFRRPGVWYGETPLEQYGMAQIELVELDGNEPDRASFEPVVAAVLLDVITAAPDVPW